MLSSGQALTALVGIVSAAVLARVFSRQDYASYRQAILALTFAIPFVTLGFDRALYHFLPGERTRERGLLVENLLWLAGGGGLLGVFLLAGGSRLLAIRFNNPDLERLLLWLAPYPLLMLPAASLPACLMACDRTGQVVAFNVGTRILMLITIVVPCLIWPTPLAAIMGTVSGAAISAGVAAVLMFIACRQGPWRPTWAGFRRQVGFSVPLGLAGLIGMASTVIDQLLVAALCTPAEFAVYINGAMEIPLIGMITGSVTAVVMVDYARYHHEGRTDDIVTLIHSAMAKSALILLPTMVFLLCVAPEVMRLLFGAQYTSSAAPFRVYLLMLPVRTLMFGAVLQATGHSRTILVQSILGLAVCTCLDYIGIRILGAIGAAIGSVVTAYFISIPYLVWALRSVLKTTVWNLFPWKTLGRLLLASAVPGVAAAAVLSVLDLPDVLRLMIASVVYGAGVVLALTLAGEIVPSHVVARLRARWSR